MARTSINLIESNTGERQDITQLTGILRKASYFAVITFVSSGILVGGVYAYLTSNEGALVAQKETLSARITENVGKESALTALKDRIAIIGKILGEQKQIDTLFDLTSTMFPAGSIKTVSMKENNETTVTVRIASITDAISIVDALIRQATARKLTRPSLTSFSLSKETGFEMTVVFVPNI